MREQCSERSQPEQCQPRHQQSAPAVSVSDRTGREQQRSQRDGVRVHDPLHLTLGGAGVASDIWQRDVQSAHRRHHHHQRQSDDNEDESQSGRVGDQERVCRMIVVGDCRLLDVHCPNITTPPT